jgi:hypothetical protein
MLTRRESPPATIATLTCRRRRLPGSDASGAIDHRRTYAAESRAATRIPDALR